MDVTIKPFNSRATYSQQLQPSFQSFPHVVSHNTALLSLQNSASNRPPPRLIGHSWMRSWPLVAFVLCSFVPLLVALSTTRLLGPFEHISTSMSHFSLMLYRSRSYPFQVSWCTVLHIYPESRPGVQAASSHRGIYPPCFRTVWIRPYARHLQYTRRRAKNSIGFFSTVTYQNTPQRIPSA